MKTLYSQIKLFVEPKVTIFNTTFLENWWWVNNCKTSGRRLPPKQFCVYIDNCFNSIPLMKHLKHEGIGCTGTLRASMLQDCPLPLMKRLELFLLCRIIMPSSHNSNSIDGNEKWGRLPYYIKVFLDKDSSWCIMEKKSWRVYLSFGNKHVIQINCLNKILDN